MAEVVVMVMRVHGGLGVGCCGNTCGSGNGGCCPSLPSPRPLPHSLPSLGLQRSLVHIHTYMGELTLAHSEMRSTMLVVDSDYGLVLCEAFSLCKS